MPEIERIAEKLARSLGHDPNCNYWARACKCKATQEQVQALYEYEKWKEGSK